MAVEGRESSQRSLYRENGHSDDTGLLASACESARFDDNAQILFALLDYAAGSSSLLRTSSSSSCIHHKNSSPPPPPRQMDTRSYSMDDATNAHRVADVRGTQSTCFTGTKVQILTQLYW